MLKINFPKFLFTLSVLSLSTQAATTKSNNDDKVAAPDSPAARPVSAEEPDGEAIARAINNLNRASINLLRHAYYDGLTINGKVGTPEKFKEYLGEDLQKKFADPAVFEAYAQRLIAMGETGNYVQPKLISLGFGGAKDKDEITTVGALFISRFTPAASGKPIEWRIIVEFKTSGTTPEVILGQVKTEDGKILSINETVPGAEPSPLEKSFLPNGAKLPEKLEADEIEEE